MRLDFSIFTGILLDLLNDITLPTDRNNPNNYIITFPQNIKEFRFYVASAQVGNRNKGRVCIGNIEIFINYWYRKWFKIV